MSESHLQPDDAAATTATRAAPMASRVEKKLRAALAPSHLEITDESTMHAVPEGAESHFRLVVVADAFEGLSAVQRHQVVYRALADEMRDHIHALGLQTMTPAEWAADQERNQSPECLGGSKA